MSNPLVLIIHAPSDGERVAELADGLGRPGRVLSADERDLSSYRGA
jgi:hypothetical protein